MFWLIGKHGLILPNIIFVFYWLTTAVLLGFDNHEKKAVFVLKETQVGVFF